MTKGSKHSEEAIRKQREASLKLGLKPPSRKGFSAWNKGMKGYINSGGFKKGHKSIKGVEKSWFKTGDKGEKSPAWKGGRTSINQKIRGSLEYKLFIPKFVLR